MPIYWHKGEGRQERGGDWNFPYLLSLLESISPLRVSHDRITVAIWSLHCLSQVRCTGTYLYRGFKLICAWRPWACEKLGIVHMGTQKFENARVGMQKFENVSSSKC